jgi:hypothetical protein
MKNLNVASVWNGAVLRFIPYWDEYDGTNPGYDHTSSIGQKFFAPNVTPIIAITLDQILQSDNADEDPITFARKR